MKTQCKTVAPELLLEEYRQLLLDGAENLPLLVSGGSMTPFLIHNRDTVYLSRLTRPARRGDILLYRRDSGAYVLHRVYRVTGGGLTMLGDAQTVPEPGIRPEQVIALVTGADRKGKHLRPGCFWWEFFEKVWPRIRPLRRPIHALYARLRGMQKKLRQNDKIFR